MNQTNIDNKLNERALRLHHFYKGKIETSIKCEIKNLLDFAIWYTPGVAEPCRAIQKNRERVFDLTNRWNTIAVVSDGTRVLGLGDIGPEAALPVMEGKALLFKYLGGVDAYPLCLSARKAEDIVQAVKWLEPSFAGINLEDIETPKCFKVLDILKKELEIPVWHDDQQGTATVIVAALINASKIVKKNFNDLHITVVGAGAAGLTTCRLLVMAGIPGDNIIIVDSKGILNKDRNDLDTPKTEEKWHWCLNTNKEGRDGTLMDALKNRDVCIGLSRPGPGVINPAMIKNMVKDSIVFSCANPIPEIWPWVAEKAGAKVTGTARSDLPNQANNSLAFPGIFRGALDVRAQTITDEMCIAAAKEIAACTLKKLDKRHVLPTMDDKKVYPRVAKAVGLKAIAQKKARRLLDGDKIYDEALQQIERSRKQMIAMKKFSIISSPP